MSNFLLRKIYLASPKGFCAGVKRAVEIVNLALEKYGSPIYVRHHIVHNRHVVSDFEKKGVIFIENLVNVPEGAVVVFSAHGSPPSLYEYAKSKKLTLIDAVCPLVTKVHLEAKRYAKEGYYILYIGHKGHPETVGVLGEVADTDAKLIGSLTDAQTVAPPKNKKVVVLSQTTYSFDDTKKIIDCLKNRFPDLILPPAFDICFATQNRQNAVKELAKKTKTILVIGSKESSNSNRLREVAEKYGANAYLIDDQNDIDVKWISIAETIGITAGASAPYEDIRAVINFLQSDKTDIEEMQTIKENVNFLLPQHL